MSNKNEYEIGQMKNQQQRGPMGGPGGHGPGGMHAGEKPKNFKKSWSKLISYSRKYLPVIIIAIVCAVGGSIATLAGPDRLRDITNLITEGFEGLMTGGGWSIDLDQIVRICIVLVVLYVSGSLLIFVQGWIMATITQKVSKRLRRDISQKINKLPLSYFDNTTFGNILSRVTNDVDTLSQTLNQSLGLLITSITMILGAVIMMMITEYRMAFTAIGSTLIGFIVITFIIKTSQKYFLRNQVHLGEINGHVEEIYAGHNIVKAYNAEKGSKKTFDEINGKLFESNWKSQFLSGLMMPLMNFIGNFGYVAVCVVGAVLAKNGMDFGIIVAFMVYIRLFTQPLAQIAQAATTLQSAAAASERIFEFLGEEELSDESIKTERLENVKGDVTFKHVKFGYTPEKNDY